MPSATFPIYIQSSFGRCRLTISSADTLYKVKKDFKNAFPEASHINTTMFRFYLNGSYLSDDSKTVEDVEVRRGATLHMMLKTVSPDASVDTEKKKDE